MGIKVNKIDNRKLDMIIESQIQKHVKILQFTGENFVNEARNAGTYKDQTGNLRSSIGYAVARGGQMSKQAKPPIVLEGSEGRSKGEAFGKELVRTAKAGTIVLKGYAAMEYAAAVEARGRDVITWATKRAIQRIKYIMERVKYDNRA